MEPEFAVAPAVTDPPVMESVAVEAMARVLETPRFWPVDRERPFPSGPVGPIDNPPVPVMLSVPVVQWRRPGLPDVSSEPAETMPP